MCFNYIKKILFFLLLFIIISNYLEIKLFSIRENNQNIEKVEAECPKDLEDNEDLCTSYLRTEVEIPAFQN